MSVEHFEVIEHTADWSIKVKGRDLDRLFIHAAEGMSSLIAGELDALPQDEERTISLAAYDVEGLLVDWLSELAYYAEMEQLVFAHFKISELTANKLRAIVRGGVAAELHKHIKAVTYHDLQVVRNEQGYEVTIVFDV
ncbi:MAG: archease [Candidatus Promineifilaceae bacterium]|nr:archease [Candidatus Promineifilaceae bacterium]